MTTNQGGVPRPTGPPPQFFVENKKGEVNELRNMLQKMVFEKDIKKQREVIKKVIAYMTLGIDVSKLFPEMVKASRTPDIIMKKMIYLYMVNYAEHNEEIAILAINTFLTDVRSKDYTIRGLALRTLCSMKFEACYQYAQQAISECLRDPDPYVKKTAIIGCIKLFHKAPQLIEEMEFVETLYKLIRDGDPNVVANAILALNEILEGEGGISISRKLIVYLLNRFKEFNEWSQSLIMDLLSKYEPKDREEMVSVMNILEDRLSQASASVMLGAVNVFLRFTRDHPDMNHQVLQRLQAPLITLMASAGAGQAHEQAYSVLSHIYLIVCKSPVPLFESDYKQFFCKYDEPSYIKSLKITILGLIANDNNYQEIISELSEYVTDVNSDLAKMSIRCVGMMGIRLPSLGRAVAIQLRGFISLKIDYVTAETLIVLKNILRKYRDFVLEFIPLLHLCYTSVTSPEAKSALIWILGEFGDQIDEAPYVIEHFIQKVSNEADTLIYYTLLTASVKLFFKRPGEMQAMLGRLFQQILADTDSSDLKEKAILYYKLLEVSPELAQRIICNPTDITDFYEDEKEEVQSKLFGEFNTFSIVYQQPEDNFLKKGLVTKKYLQEMEGEQEVERIKKKELEVEVSSEVTTEGGDESIDVPLEGSGTQGGPAPIPISANLLELAEGFGEEEEKLNEEVNQPAAAETPSLLEAFGYSKAVAMPPGILLDPAPILETANFQTMWMSQIPMNNLNLTLSKPAIEMKEIEGVLGNNKIFIMANADLGTELLIDKMSCKVMATVKSQSQELMDKFGQVLKTHVFAHFAHIPS